MAGERSAALRVVEEMEARAKTGYSSLAGRGNIYLALGANERGYELLRQACAENDFILRHAKVDPLLDPLRKDPRFHDVLKCVHLE
jgi:hypothetical protein